MTHEQKTAQEELSVLEEMMMNSPFDTEAAENEDFGCEDGVYHHPCFLRYYVDGNAIYISSEGNLYYEPDYPAALVELNHCEECKRLSPIAWLPEETRMKLMGLRQLKKLYEGEYFAVIAQGENEDTLIVCSERFPHSFTGVTLKLYVELQYEHKAALAAFRVRNTVDQPCGGI